MFRSTLCLLQLQIIELKKKVNYGSFELFKKLPKFFFCTLKQILKNSIFFRSQIFSKSIIRQSSIRVSGILPLKHSKLVASNDRSHLVEEVELSFGVWLSSLDDSSC